MFCLNFVKSFYIHFVSLSLLITVPLPGQQLREERFILVHGSWPSPLHRQEMRQNIMADEYKRDKLLT